MNNIKIPKNIFLSIPDKEILKNQNNKITIIINKIKKEYSNYKVIIYDDLTSYQLIKEYDDELLKICYEELLPGAFKCDIFRLVVLEQFGGIYIDIGLYPNPTFFLPLLNDNELVLCEDRPLHFSGYKIYNAIMASVKNHVFLKKLIEKIKYNVIHFKYGVNMLDITGPVTVGTLFNEMYHTKKADNKRIYSKYIFNLKSDLKHICVNSKVNKNLSISDNLGNIVCEPKVRDSTGKSQIISPSKECNHYSYLWNKKLVFFQLVYSCWHKTAKGYYIDKEGYLCSHLKDLTGKWKFSRIKYNKNTLYSNINGNFVINEPEPQ